MLTQSKIGFKIFTNASKNIKILQHTALQTQHTITRKLNIDKAFIDTVDKRPPDNSGFGKKRVQRLIENSTEYFGQTEPLNPELPKEFK